MSNVVAIIRRELTSYFTTPLGYVFIFVFLLLSGLFTFWFGQLYEAGQASLNGFFGWHPFLYLFLVPAVSMRLWSEERKSGTIELLFTLPVSLGQAVIGKYVAALIFLAISLGLTFPLVLSVYYLGDPDGGIIVSSYIGSLLMAAAYLSIGCSISAMTKNQVISFVVSVLICFAFVIVGVPDVVAFLNAYAPAFVAEAATSISFLDHFTSIQRGVFDLTDAVFFASLAVGWLVFCAIVLDVKKAS